MKIPTRLARKSDFLIDINAAHLSPGICTVSLQIENVYHTVDYDLDSLGLDFEIVLGFIS